MAKMEITSLNIS